MKKIYLLATALAALVSCTSDDFTGEPNLQESNNGKSISFNLNTPAVTRAENKTGAGAAEDLNYQFIIWGEKNEINDGETGANVTTAPGTPGRDGDLVFENYIVRWTDNSAYTTTSNTKNWEYVGYKFDDSTVNPVTTNYSTNITPNTTGETAIVQTIKYWDYNASSYTFTAVSALPADISSGKVKITKHTSGTTVYDKGYEIAVNTGASLDKIFVADRNQPTVGTGTNREAENAYGGNVTMSFRNFMSKIRFGIYENIPGYKVNITNVEYNNTGSSTTNKFGVDGKFLAIGDGSTTNTIFTVTYDTNNKALVNLKSETTPGTADYLETAQSDAESPILSSTAASPISISSASPTWDKTGGAYTTILPYTTNATNIKVKLDFTLTSEDTNETINVEDATAEIPAEYCQWKSNYAYTYILKLNDNTNGQIGGVTGLYPITFDAVEVVDENGKAEYITTVSEPSITTFGYNTTTNKYITGGSDYPASTDVYATVEDNHTHPTLSADNMLLYTVATTNATQFPMTEASVAEYLIESPLKTKAVANEFKVRATASDALSYVKIVKAEDGTDLNMDGTDNKAVKFTTAASTTYALVYQKEAATYTWDSGKNDYTAETFAAAGALYTLESTVYTLATSFTDGTTYYKPKTLTSKGNYVVKIVTCPAP